MFTGDSAAIIAVILSVLNTVTNWAVMREQVKRINAALDKEGGVLATQKDHEHRVTYLEAQHKLNHGAAQERRP